MTVLAAFWSLEERPSREGCAAMIRTQTSNPNAPALWCHEAMALGMSTGTATRMAASPVTGASGNLVLVADARLDNRADLLGQLGISGAHVARLSDPEVMMLAFERWELDATRRFLGDFAFVLWDKAAAQLHLARDFAGQRPLFFHRSPRGVAVASMASGIHALDFVPRRPDRQRMLETLAGLPHEGSRSFFEGVERVEPGEILTLGRSTQSSRAYWSPPRGRLRLRNHADYAEALIEKLGRAVEARLRDAGGRIGTHLSAGLDSSAVAALAAERFDGRVLAFTSIPSGDLPALPGGRFGDEGALAARTASLYANIEHRLVETGDRIPLEDLAWQLELFERPDLNLPNLAWSNRINDAAMAGGVTVMLTGAGGNGTFSYGDAGLLREFVRKGLIGSFVRECVAAHRPRTLVSTPAAVLARAVLSPRLFRRLRHPHARPRHELPIINPAAPEAAQILERFATLAVDDFPDSTVTRWQMLRRVDPGSLNKGVQLRWNIELRDPTADRELVEFCMQVPIDQFFRGGMSRALARTSLEGRVPDTVRFDPKRGLQSANWFAMLSNAREEAGRLLDALSCVDAARELLDLDEMRRLYREWPLVDGAYGPPEYRTSLLRGLSAGTFMRLCITPRGLKDRPQVVDAEGLRR